MPSSVRRLSAVLAIIGVADVPLVVMATRWFRGIHPVSPEMEPSMRLALLASVVGLTALMTLLVVRRRNQLRLESRVAAIQMLVDERSGALQTDRDQRADQNPNTDKPYLKKGSL